MDKVLRCLLEVYRQVRQFGSSRIDVNYLGSELKSSGLKMVRIQKSENVRSGPRVLLSYKSPQLNLHTLFDIGTMTR